MSGARTPKLRWWRELLYILAFYSVYTLIRNTQGSATVSEATAFSRRDPSRPGGFATTTRAEAGPHTAATITAHHLLYNRNALFTGGLRPHWYG